MSRQCAVATAGAFARSNNVNGHGFPVRLNWYRQLPRQRRVAVATVIPSRQHIDAFSRYQLRECPGTSKHGCVTPAIAYALSHSFRILQTAS